VWPQKNNRGSCGGLPTKRGVLFFSPKKGGFPKGVFGPLKFSGVKAPKGPLLKGAFGGNLPRPTGAPPKKVGVVLKTFYLEKFPKFPGR